MRFVRLLAATAALALSAQADHAHAAKVFEISGTLTPDQWGYSTFGIETPMPVMISPYTQALTFRFSRPVTGYLDHYVYAEYQWRYKDGTVWDANDTELQDTIPISGGTFAVTRLRSPVSGSPHSFYDGMRYYTTNIYSNQASIWLEEAPGSAPVNFTLTGFSATPEPATWALMILGFGAIGGAMRRRRAAPAFAVCTYNH